ncbi:MULTISPECIES: hypothetical protein [Acinetobacter]|uniref:hypothetical protein n=1 Tax=Acinetobacter TaxID=469 RepID=UPI001F60A0B0|nr:MULTISPECIES: hypothetical protein [Acinetobacter]UNT44423.1 hypothetical protein MN200_06625 [Acinetobacter sp. LUNF3]
MKISRLASTIFLAATISTIYLFGLIFYTLNNIDGNKISILKDSISLTSNFFGGIAALIAAYIATQLFNDWREQHNKEVTNVFRLKVLEQYELFCEAVSAYRLSCSHLESNLFQYALAEQLSTPLVGLDSYENEREKILQKIQEIEINYDDLCRKLKQYGRASNSMNMINRNIQYYQEKLTEISDNQLRNMDLNTFSAYCSGLEVGYLDLQNMINDIDCSNIIDSLKVENNAKS